MVLVVVSVGVDMRGVDGAGLGVAGKLVVSVSAPVLEMSLVIVGGSRVTCTFCLSVHLLLPSLTLFSQARSKFQSFQLYFRGLYRRLLVDLGERRMYITD